jgi:hypothetical protein
MANSMTYEPHFLTIQYADIPTKLRKFLDDGHVDAKYIVFMSASITVKQNIFSATRIVSSRCNDTYCPTYFTYTTQDGRNTREVVVNCSEYIRYYGDNGAEFFEINTANGKLEMYFTELGATLVPLGEK